MGYFAFVSETCAFETFGRVRLVFENKELELPALTGLLEQVFVPWNQFAVNVALSPRTPRSLLRRGSAFLAGTQGDPPGLSSASTALAGAGRTGWSFPECASNWS